MSEARDFLDFRNSSEESSLVLFLDIARNGSPKLREYLAGKEVNLDALSRSLSSKLGSGDYQDDECVRAIFQRAKTKQGFFQGDEKDLCLLASLLSYGKCLACQTLSSFGLDCYALYFGLADFYGFEASVFKRKGIIEIKKPKGDKKQDNPFRVGSCGTDLSAYYKANQPKVFKGRTAYLERISRVLGKMNHNSVLLLGEPGTGKTALINEFAVHLAKGKIRGSLAGASIVRLDIELIDPVPMDFSGVKEMLMEIFSSCEEKDKVIFFLDWQVFELAGGDLFSTFNALSILKQCASDFKTRLIITGNPEAYEDFLLDFPEVAGTAEIIKLEEPDNGELLEILRASKGSYEIHHGVSFSDESLQEILSKPEAINSGLRSPGKVLELLDMVGSHFSAKGVRNIGKKEVSSFCSKESSCLVAGVKVVGDRRLAHLSEMLKKEVIGQDGPCQAVANAVVSLSNPESPIASLFFVGPSGVGKTLLAKKLSKAMFGNDEGFFRFDMSEYHEEHLVSRLIGSPPGYVGYGEGGQLTEKVRKRPNAVVLFDEIEKAHPSIYNIFLQILSDGVLTDGKGNPFSFNQAIIIMTSNIDIKKGGQLGFSPSRNQNQEEMDYRTALQKNNFRRELVGRIDEIIKFNSLTRDDFLKILELELEKIRTAAFKKGLKELNVDQAAKELLVDKSETSEYGARSLNRTLRQLLRIPLGQMIISNRRLEKVSVSAVDSRLLFV